MLCVSGSFVDADGHEEVGLSDSIDEAAWQRLVTQGVLTLGGVRASASTSTAASLLYTTSIVSSVYNAHSGVTYLTKLLTYLQILKYK